MQNLFKILPLWSVLLIASLLPGFNFAQNATLEYRDMVYDPAIRTIQFYVEGNEMGYPIIPLRSPGRLILEFDELVPWDQDPEDFYVGFLPADANWEPVNVLPIEFLDGVTYDRIYNWQRSQNTKVPYFHYEYILDPERIAFTQSGNYLLYVYRAGDEEDITFSRRMIVADNKVGIKPNVGQTIDVSQRMRLQTVSFDLFTSGMQINNPYQDLEVVILQNFRWDNAATHVQPQFVQGDRLQYVFDAATEFKGGNEYRMVDLRSTRFHSQRMESVRDLDSIFYVRLWPEEPRLTNRYLSQYDFNGSYFVGVQEWPNADYEADYLLVKFSLNFPESMGNDKVYLFSKMTDWRAQDEFECVFNADTRRYETGVLLKQGVYDYQYVVKDGKTGHLDESRLEGSHYETENVYSILVYYKNFTDRNHQLVGIAHINYFK
ncbi:MAG: DUF5103 domain-containing protein [Bacteroidia bacterium]|nr:DUF5103 domain-containing protein [Bacteroidia bacterium]